MNLAYNKNNCKFIRLIINIETILANLLEYWSRNNISYIPFYSIQYSRDTDFLDHSFENNFNITSLRMPLQLENLLS